VTTVLYEPNLLLRRYIPLERIEAPLWTYLREADLLREVYIAIKCIKVVWRILLCRDDESDDPGRHRKGESNELLNSDNAGVTTIIAATTTALRRFNP
jgi:hypothetical protein